MLQPCTETKTWTNATAELTQALQPELMPVCASQ